MYRIYHGDALQILKGMEPDSVHAMITDPPAGIGFMNKAWDKDKGGRDQWIAWLLEIMIEARRVLKPGAHGLVWALPKTSHWTATALEDAGFEIRDVITHHFGSGFPKNHDVSKAMDKAVGAKRDVIGEYDTRALHEPKKARRNSKGGSVDNCVAMKTRKVTATIPNTEAAKQWDGWGTALKPATENWILVRKPLQGTVASNVLKHGTGAINIDAARVKHQEECKMMRPQDPDTLHNPKLQQGGRHKETLELKPAGRWPANLVLSHHPDCVLNGVKKVAGREPRQHTGNKCDDVVTLAHDSAHDGFVGADGKEEVADWKCVDGCPVRILGEQSGVRKNGILESHHKRSKPRLGFDGVYGDDMGRSGIEFRYGDKGTAARYFQQFHPIEHEHEPGFLYQSKPSKKEKNAGLEGKNSHPTIKPVKLMSYFARLIAPPGGTVFDPFMGSGTTGVAAIKENFDFVGIEKEDEYIKIARQRIEHAREEATHG